MPQEGNSRQSSQGLIHSLSASFSNAREEEHSAQEELMIWEQILDNSVLTVWDLEETLFQ